MLSKEFNEFVPFIGVVEDVNDPLKLGRVRVRVFSHHGSTVATEDLDWATQLLPNSMSVAGVGTSPTWIENGTTVVGFYLDGPMRSIPLILGSFGNIPGNDESLHALNELARGIKPSEQAKVGTEPTKGFAGKYPHNKVTATPGGHIIEVDDTPGAERVHVYHKSGSYVEINNTGRIVIKSADDQYNIVAGDETNYVKGKSTTDIKGKMAINVKGKFDLVADGTINIKSKGKVNIKGSGINLN